MGRPRTPTNVLEAQGAFKKDPQRRRARGEEPQSTLPIGNPPKGLKKPVAAAWREIVETAPLNVLTGADRVHLEIVATLLVRFRDGALTGTELSRLHAMLGQLGMNPSDRSKMGVLAPPTRERDNPFATLRRG